MKMNSGATTSLTDGRVLIRPITMEDVTPAYVDWLRDPEVNQYLETSRQQTEKTVREFVKAMIADDSQHLFAICLLPGKHHVGNIKVGPVRKSHKVADVSLFIGDRNAWGKGVATAAIKLVSRHAFDSLAVQKLSASMYTPNTGSARAFEKAGYQREGLRRRHLMKDGEMWDIFEYGLCADDPAVIGSTK